MNSTVGLMCGKEHISLVVHGLLFQQCLCLHQQGDNTSDCTECIINLKWSEMIWPGLTVWEHLTSDCSFWNQSSQTTRPPDHQTTRPPDHQTTRPPDHQTTRPPDHQTTRLPDLQILRTFQTTPDQSDHQTSWSLECQISQITRPPDHQIIRPLQTTPDHSDH